MSDLLAPVIIREVFKLVLVPGHACGECASRGGGWGAVGFMVDRLVAEEGHVF